MEIKIRQAQISDIKQLIPLIKELGYDLSPDELKQTIELQNKNSYEVNYIAEKEKNIIGLISCSVLRMFHHNYNTGRIVSLVVSSCERNQNIGEKLIQIAELYFKSLNCKKIEITTNNKREDAHRFYFNQNLEDTHKCLNKSL